MNAPDVTLHVTDKQLAGLSKGIRLDAITSSKLENLRALCQAKIDANESFTDACKAVAESANIHPSALATYVTALVEDTLEKQHEKAEQLSLLFDELGG